LKPLELDVFSTVVRWGRTVTAVSLGIEKKEVFAGLENGRAFGPGFVSDAVCGLGSELIGRPAVRSVAGSVA
jgi:hypothetical protein